MDKRISSTYTSDQIEILKKVKLMGDNLATIQKNIVVAWLAEHKDWVE